MKKSAKKLTVAVIYGGRSGEHEVSLQSAASALGALDKCRYVVRPVIIDKDGRWSVPRGGQYRKTSPTDALRGVDVALPLVHGTGGEDGCLQGLLETLGIPYVGSGVLGSAVGMDKALQKRLLRDAGIAVTPWVEFLDRDWREFPREILKRADRLAWPVFVKPANLGSSVGISKVKSRAALPGAIRRALRYDDKVIIEQGVKDADEVECAVLGETARPHVSVPGQIVTGADFYDYETKYTDGCAELVIPARLAAAVARRVRAMAALTYTTLAADGFSRVDFFVTRSARPKVIVNEINTIPGFTRFSMFPKLWAESGLTYPKLLDRMIGLALDRARRRNRLIRDFRSRS